MEEVVGQLFPTPKPKDDAPTISESEQKDPTSFVSRIEKETEEGFERREEDVIEKSGKEWDKAAKEFRKQQEKAEERAKKVERALKGLTTRVGEYESSGMLGKLRDNFRRKWKDSELQKATENLSKVREILSSNEIDALAALSDEIDLYTGTGDSSHIGVRNAIYDEFIYTYITRTDRAKRLNALDFSQFAPAKSNLNEALGLSDQANSDQFIDQGDNRQSIFGSGIDQENKSKVVIDKEYLVAVNSFLDIISKDSTIILERLNGYGAPLDPIDSLKQAFPLAQ
jgi:hypothetical protein